MMDTKNRLHKAIGLALGVHLAGAALLGAFFWSPLYTPNDKIIEVALAGAPKKKKAAKPIVKPKPVIKPRKDDIVDKRLKPPEPVQEQVQEQPEETDNDSSGSDTGTEGANGTGTQPTEQPGQAVQLPYITYSTQPPYPNEARKNGVEGSVRVRVLIDTNGRVTEASVSSSSGSSLLDQAALQTVYKWRFSPAKDAQGRKVPCYVNIPVIFRLRK